MRQILKHSLKLLIILLLMATLGAAGLWLVSEYYGDEIEQAVVNEVNQHLSVEVNVTDIRFSVFENFPFAAVTLYNVSTESASAAEQGPLIKAGEVSILFNLLNLVSRKYIIERLIIRDGFVNLAVHHNGTRNFDIFKNSQTTRANNIDLKLTRVIFKNIGVSYIHYPTDQEYLFKVSKGSLHAEFTQYNQQFGFTGQVLTDYIRSGKTTLLSGKDLNLQLQIAQKEQGNLVVIETAEIETDGMHFHLNGSINLADTNRLLALEIDADPAPINSFLKLVPLAFLEPVKDYKMDGILNFRATVNGKFSGNNLPEIEFIFGLTKGVIENPGTGFRADELSLKGVFNNGEKRQAQSFDLRLTAIDGQIHAGSIKGNLRITNFFKPFVNADLIAGLNLATLHQHAHFKGVDKITGNLHVDMSFSNQLQSFRQFTIHDFISSRTAGSLRFEKMNFTLTNNNLSFDNFDGSFHFSNKDLLIDRFTGSVSGNDFSMKGYFGNILAFTFIPDEPVYISADFTSKQLNLDALLAYSNNSGDAQYRLAFSPKVEFDLDVQIDQFAFRKFQGTQLRGKFSMKNQNFYVKQGSIAAMDGMVSMDGMIQGASPGPYQISCNADFLNVDIKQLFTQFGNFGQQNLTHQHLQGRATANVHYKSSLSPALYVDPASVFAMADITIQNGELIGYTPLYALSRYIKKEELEHIKFSTLKNNIKIENQVIYVPSMEISSNTMDISIYGTHTFDNITDYHFKLYLADLLKGNKKQKPAEQIEGIFETDDEAGKPRLFLSMTGPADDPVIKYDTREVRNKIASDISKEKEEFKSAMRQEFKWLLKKPADSVPGSVKATTSPKDFAIGWDEVKKEKTPAKSSEQPATPTDSKAVKSDNKTFIIKWDESNDTIR